MRKYCFLTLTDTAPDLNPGSILISDGIKALVHLADPDAVLQDISLFRYNALHWQAMLENTDAIFLCGNPRFDPSDTSFFWLTDLLEFMSKAHDQGIKVGDLFFGSAFPLPLKDIPIMATELLFSSRNVKTATYLAGFDLLVSRDPLSQHICDTEIGDGVLLHDSTFWAKDYYGITSGKKLYNCVSIPALNCTQALVEELVLISFRLGEEKQTYLLCHCLDQYRFIKDHFPNSLNVILIWDPRSLLRFYSHVDKLVSCRLHGSIPALSLGAKVMNISVDSRSAAFDFFGFSSVSYVDLASGNYTLSFNPLPGHLYPSATPFILQFKKKIMEG